MPHLLTLTRAQLISRIRELESLSLGQPDLFHNLSVHITSQQQAILGALYLAKSRWLSSGQLCDIVGKDLSWTPTLKTQICYLRKTLTQLHITIESAPGRGYRLPPHSRTILESHLAERETLRVRNSPGHLRAPRSVHPCPVGDHHD